MKQRKKKEEGGADWMGTYGDMVTLLLCFFVLLYSISSVDQTKWENLVKSLNPEAAETSQIVTDELADADGENLVSGGNPQSVDEQFDEIYDNLLELKEESTSMSDVQITSGEGYHFITFNDSVFFDGDSYVLREEGRVLIDQLADALAPSAEAIKEIQVLGHTSQGDPNIPNEVTNDRILSASRAAVVVAQLQEKNFISPEKLVGIGYGQFRPIAPFDTFENRAKNRRVEIKISKTGSVEQSLDEYYAQVYGETP